MYRTQVSVVTAASKQICHAPVSFVYLIVQNQQGPLRPDKVFSLRTPFNKLHIWNRIKATLPFAVTPNYSLRH